MRSTEEDYVKYLNENINSIERLVYYKISNNEDAKDILQEVFLSGFINFKKLQDKSKFKGWILKIAKNKCNDYYRKTLGANNISIDDYIKQEVFRGVTGLVVKEVVDDTMELLEDKDRTIILYHYIYGMKISDISDRLNIPIGTVKSRLYKARKNFKEKYIYSNMIEEEKHMSNLNTKLPNIIPEIKIERIFKECFSAKCEEDLGWFIIPKLAQKVEWAMYDYPIRRMTSLVQVSVVGEAKIHGVDCVQIVSDENIIEGNKKYSNTFFTKLTDNHIQTLAEYHNENGIMVMSTFYDEDFLEKFGLGSSNEGIETNLSKRGIIDLVDDNNLISKQRDAYDIVGRYNVTIGNRSFDTVRMIFIDKSDVLIDRYIDINGRTILWRRYNKNNWNVGKDKGFKEYWVEQLPNNNKITINNELYVHWYDCISEYVV